MSAEAQIEILKIVQHILWLVSAFWLGYELGKQHICSKLLEKDLERLKNHEYSRITKTNNR